MTEQPTTLSLFEPAPAPAPAPVPTQTEPQTPGLLIAYSDEQDARRMAAILGGHARRRPHDNELTGSEAAELRTRPWGVYAQGDPRPWVECVLCGAAPILNAHDAALHLEAAHGITELSPPAALRALLGMAVDVVSDSEVSA